MPPLSNVQSLPKGGNLLSFQAFWGCYMYRNLLENYIDALLSTTSPNKNCIKHSTVSYDSSFIPYRFSLSACPIFEYTSKAMKALDCPTEPRKGKLSAPALTFQSRLYFWHTRKLTSYIRWQTCHCIVIFSLN